MTYKHKILKKSFKTRTVFLKLFLGYLILFNSLPSYSQSGFSSISSFFNKEKQGSENSEENPSEKIKEILVEGNRLVPTEKILEAINSKTGEPFIKEQILSDLEAIDNLGYFIRESIQATPEKLDDGILLKITIEENNPISKVQVQGNKILDSEDLLLALQGLIGMPESLSEISKCLDAIENKYQESGFVLAKVSDISLEPDGTLIVSINEGEINKISIEGNTKTKEKYIKRYIPNLNSGETYNELLLVQDFRSLNATGLFEEINRKVSPSEEFPGKYDLTIEVKEKRSASFGFGGGLNSLNGAFVNAGISNNNLFGEGKVIAANGQVGSGALSNTTNSLTNQKYISNKKSFQLDGRYTDPAFLNSKNSVSFLAHGYNYNSYLVDLAQEKNLGAGVSINRPLGMNFFGGIDLLGEDVKMEEFNSNFTDFLTDQLVKTDNGKYLDGITEKNAFKPGQLFGSHQDSVKRDAAKELAKEIRKEQLQGGKFVSFNPTLSFDTRDNQLSPTKGWNNMISAGQSVGIGNSSFSKLGVDLRRYIPVGKKTTLAFNLQGSSKVLGDVPIYSQFKPGGYYGVRGYRTFSDLGIGSRTFLSSAEVRTSILDKLPWLKNTPAANNVKLALFSDLGYVGGGYKVKRLNELSNRLTLASSVGLGVRANIPILGPVRVDYGLPMIKPLWNNAGILGRFNFGLGERF